MAAHPDLVSEKMDIAWDFARRYPTATLDERLDNFKKAYRAISGVVLETDGIIEDSEEQGDDE